MAFYKAGTVSVTNGSTKVTGAGTLFVTGAPIGTLFQGPDKGLYEIVNVPSDTELTIDPPYSGGTAGGQSYKIIPTTQYLAEAAARMADLITGFAAVRDGIGQGLISAGTVALPGIRFSADQDTGLRRWGENAQALVSGGVDAISIDANRHVGIGVTQPTVLSQSLRTLHLYGSSGSLILLDGGAGALGQVITDGNGAVFGTRTAHPTIFTTQAAERMRIDVQGRVGFGTATPTTLGHFASPTGPQITVENTGATNDNGISYKTTARTWNMGQNIGGSGSGSFNLFDVTRGAPTWTADTAGNFLVGVTGGSCHVFRKDNAAGSQISLWIQGGGLQVGAFYAVDGSGLDTASSAPAALKVGKASNGRSVNAGGTFNASGADYAEYMRKAKACGVLAKGQIVGIDADGRVTDKFSLAHSFVIKSTDPAYVGGDTWSPGPPPAEPLLVLPTYDGPAEPVAPEGVARELPAIGDRPVQPVQKAGEELIDFIVRMAGWVNADAAWVAAMDARPKEVEAMAIATAADAAAKARYAIDLPVWKKAMADQAAKVVATERAHDAAMVQYAADKAAWDAEMERCRQCVDRIAFSGQVPVNVAAGTFKPGDYIVAKAGKNDAIVGVVITNANMRLTPGLRVDAVGKVWRTMEDGRAWCAVLIG